jgi:hypothetical protein
LSRAECGIRTLLKKRGLGPERSFATTSRNTGGYVRVLQQFAIALTPFILNADSFPLLSMQNPSTTIRFEYLGQNAKGFCDRVLVPDYKNLSHFGCVKASGFNDRKASCIELILHALRSLNRESFHVSPNVKDFRGIVQMQVIYDNWYKISLLFKVHIIYNILY